MRVKYRVEYVEILADGTRSAKCVAVYGGIPDVRTYLDARTYIADFVRITEYADDNTAGRILLMHEWFTG